MFEQSRRRVVPTEGLRGAVDNRQGVAARVGTTDRRTPRGSELRRAVAALDTTLDPAQRAALASWIAQEYRLSIGSMPVGFVSTCHLGPPYVDHYLDLLGQIVEHFGASSRMPDPFESARMLARASAYDYIEVHSDGTLVPVKPDGQPVAHTTSPA